MRKDPTTYVKEYMYKIKYSNTVTHTQSLATVIIQKEVFERMHLAIKVQEVFHHLHHHRDRGADLPRLSMGGEAALLSYA